MKRIVVFDTETTGLPKYKRIIATDKEGNWPDLVSICWRVFDNKVETSSKYYIIKPDGWEIPAEASKIHGISHATAVKTGADLRKVLLEFKEDVIDANMIVAHNLEFDKNVILNAFRWRLQLPVIFWPSASEFCTAEMTKAELKLPGKFPNSNDPYKLPRLNELYEDTFKVPAPPDDHSAVRDVDVLQKILWKRWVL